MSYHIACNRNGFIGQQPQLYGLGQKLRNLARASLVGGLLLAGSAVVITSWLPVSVQQTVAPAAELYLQDPADAPVTRKDLGDSISASTVLGTTLR